MPYFKTVDLIAQPIQTVEYLVDQLIPTEGIVLIYGKWGVGKTPYTWDLARSVASGAPFMNLATTKSRVAYIEVDTPMALVQKRLQPRFGELPPDICWSFLYGKSFNCLSNTFSSSEPYKEILDIKETFDPQLVIINTLRKVHAGEEIKGHVPNEVYQRFQIIFPNTCVCFVHHDRKSSKDINYAPDSESFSGHQAWLNDAQVGIHLVKVGKYVRFDHTKSQFSEELPSLTMEMTVDACSFDVLKYKQADEVRKILTELDGKKDSMTTRQIDQFIASKIGKTERHARRIRTSLGHLGQKAMSQR